MLGKRVHAFDDEDLVRAATHVLGVHGPVGVTRDRVADALGVRPQHLPPSLDPVLADAYRRLSVDESARVKRMILSNPSPVEQMRALLSVLATPPQDNSDAYRMEAWVLARSNAALRDAVQESASAWHALVVSVIRRGARSGHFHQADADEVAALVIALVEGINAYQTISYRSDVDRTRLLVRILKAELGMAWGPDLKDALS